MVVDSMHSAAGIMIIFLQGKRALDLMSTEIKKSNLWDIGQKGGGDTGKIPNSYQ